MNSSSERLLEILRKLEYDGSSEKQGYNFTGWSLSYELNEVNGYLGHQWEIVNEFFNKITAALEENLRVVRNELEIYSQSSLAKEGDLDAVVREVNDKASEILKKLAII